MPRKLLMDSAESPPVRPVPKNAERPVSRRFIAAISHPGLYFRGRTAGHSPYLIPQAFAAFIGPTSSHLKQLSNDYIPS